MKTSDKTFNELSKEEQAAFDVEIRVKQRQLEEQIWLDCRKRDGEIMHMRRLAEENKLFIEANKPNLNVDIEEIYRIYPQLRD